MQTITLYKYTREDGGTTVSPIKPEGEYTEMYRLVADEGQVLTNGETTTTCADTDTAEGWTEIDAPPDEEEENPIDPDTTTYAELAQVYAEGVNGLE